MPLRTVSPADPYGFLPRLVRFVTGLAAIAVFFTGAEAAPRQTEMTEAQLIAALATEDGPLQRFIDGIERSATSGAIGEVETLMDRDAILTRATLPVSFEGDRAIRDLFCDSTRRGWDSRGITQEYAGTKFRYLRTRTLGGRPGLLFRSSTREGSINYALFVVRQAGPGEFRVVDIFFVGLNEFLSDTLRRTWINVAAGFLGEKAAAIKGANPAYVAHIEDIAELSRLMNKGEYTEVLKTAAALPESLQKERTVLLIRMEAAGKVSLEELAAVYDTWLEKWPDEMELPLRFVDFYTAQHRWDDAERVLRGLIDRLGSDALLKMELGKVMYERRHEAAGDSGLSLR